MDTIIIVLSLWQSDANQHDSDGVTFDLHNGIVFLYFIFLIIHVPWITEIVFCEYFWDTCIKKIHIISVIPFLHHLLLATTKKQKQKTSKNLFFVQSAEWLWTFNLHNFYSVYDGPPLNCQVLLRLLQVLMTQLSASALLKSFNRLLDVWFYLRLTKIDK